MGNGVRRIESDRSTGSIPSGTSTAHAPRGPSSSPAARDPAPTHVDRTVAVEPAAPPPPRELTVRPQNFRILQRLDTNRDGTIESREALDATRHAGTRRFTNEVRELNAEERAALADVAHGGSIRVMSGTGSERRQVGVGADRRTWRDTESEMYRSQASSTAPLGTVGQGRPTNTSNNDCGPAGALFMNDRRVALASGGTAPVRTQAEADALIRSMSRTSGTTGPEMRGIMNDNFAHAGGRFYTFGVHDVNPTNLSSVLMTGLAADPGGVMVPIVATHNEDSTSGTRHWLVVTAFDGNNVTYYDPAVPDGASHMQSMSIDDLRGSLPDATDPLSAPQAVYGTSVAESTVAGALPVGRRIGELEVRFSNRDLNVTSTGGVHGSRADAQAAAQAIAGRSGEDAIVRREGSAYAVYGISEIRSQFGGLWSDNTLSDLNRDISDVYMTDQTSGSTRRARSGP